MLARFDEAEFAAGQILDRGGVAAKPLGFLAQHLVLRARAPDRLLERPELLTLLHGLEQSLLPDERVHEDHATDQQQRVLNGPSSAAAGRAGVRSRRR